MRTACLISLAMLLCLSGCASKIEGGRIKREAREGEETMDIKGGEARMANADLRVEIEPSGKVVIQAERASIATTQPSIRTATTRPSEITETVGPSASGYGAMPKTGTVTEGKLGGVSFDEMSRTIRSNWPLFGIFAVLAAASWYFFRSIGLALLFAGLALLSAVYPALLAWLAIAAVLAFLALNWKTIRELVKGGDNVADAARTAAADVKVQMERAHGALTKGAVRAAKGK